MPWLVEGPQRQPSGVGLGLAEEAALLSSALRPAALRLAAAQCLGVPPVRQASVGVASVLLRPRVPLVEVRQAQALVGLSAALPRRQVPIRACLPPGVRATL